ncbi:MAG: VanZ family protein [Labilithrix sp.]|nr:VanZ family protein [Labilithrix sp.]
MLERAIAFIRASRWWLGFFVITAIGGYLTVIAYVEGLPDVFRSFAHFDKGAHFACAGLLAFFLDGALRRRSFSVFGVSVPVAALVVLVPAGVEEYAQRYATFRTSSLWDFAADVAGVAVFIPLSRRAGAWAAARSPRAEPAPRSSGTDRGDRSSPPQVRADPPP